MTADETAELGRSGRHTGRRRLRSWLPPSWQGRGIVVAVITAAALGLGGYSLAAFQLRANEQAARVDEAVSAVDQLCRQVRDLGGYCVVDPAELRGEPGPEGPPGPPPSDEQVMEAVAAYLAEHPIEPGRPPTMAEISAAVAAYLAEHEPPQGERGPGPSPEQVAGAVAAYLLASPPPAGPEGPEGPVGPAGPTGDPGVPGADGRDGADGQPPTSWTFTYQPWPVGPPVTYECTRTEPFDPQAPTYRCQPQP